MSLTKRKKSTGLVWNNDILDAILDNHDIISQLQKEVQKMALNLDNLVAEVARLETVEKSAVELIKQLMDEVMANKDNPAELEALVSKMKNSTDALAAAVATVPGPAPIAVVEPIPEPAPEPTPSPDQPQ